MATLDDIEVFLATAETSGFAAAARRLNVTTAAVSKAIARLEARLGARLFHRTTRKVSLSEAGEAYYAHARRALEHAAAAEDAVRQLNREPTGRLRVAAPMSFGLERVAAWVPAFLARYPGLELDLNLDDRTVDLVEGGFDLAVRIGRLPDSSLVARRLGELPVHVVATPEYLRRHGTPAHPHELQQHNCLLFSYTASGAEWTFDGEATDGPVSVSVAGNYRVNSSMALRTAVLEHAGIARIPEYQVKTHLDSGALVKLLPGWRLDALEAHAVLPERVQVPVKTRLFIEFVRERMHEGAQ